MSLLSGRLSAHSARFRQVLLKFWHCTIKTIESFCLRQCFRLLTLYKGRGSIRNFEGSIDVDLFKSSQVDHLFCRVMLPALLCFLPEHCSGPIFDRFPLKFDVQTSYKPLNYVLGLIFVVNIKFAQATNRSAYNRRTLLFK